MKGKRTLTATAVALTQISLVTWWFENTVVVYTGIILSSLLLLGVFKFHKPYVLMFLVTGVSGFIAEAIVVTRGAWEYATPEWLGLPLWLFLIWGSTGVMFTHFGAKAFEKYGK